MARAKRLPRPLDEVIRFRHDETIDRFCEAYFIARADAVKLFKDLMRYLWVVATEPTAEKLQPVPVVDEMWHTFLMFTPAYTRWSNENFGYFLHHLPTSKKDKQARARVFARSPERAHAQLRDETATSVSTVWSLLGERVALRWYVKYATRYNAKFFDNRRPDLRTPIRLPQALIDRAARF